MTVNINEELSRIDYNLLKDTLMDSVEISDYLSGVAGELDIGVTNKIKCPLPNHDDSTPSFFFDDGKKLFKCFGCGKGGTVVELHQHMTEKGKKDAIEDLCKIYGIELELIHTKIKKDTSKGRDYFKKLRDRSKDDESVLYAREEKAVKMVEDYAEKLSKEKQIKLYQLSDKLYLSVGLSNKEKLDIINNIEGIIKRK